MQRLDFTSSLSIALSLFLTMPGSAQTPSVDRRIADALAQVSATQLEANLERLQSFETRHTMSALRDSTGWGIRAAREWILAEFQSYSPRLQASLDCYEIPPQGRITSQVELCNVVAVLPGRSTRRIYVSGHFDSLARIPGARTFDWSTWDNFAPGANDDGSGTVLTMEAARVVSQSNVEFDATLVFMAVAGEEEGLVGARLHAQQAAADSVPIDAVFNNDIIGNSAGGNGIVDSRTVRVFSAGPEDSPSRQLARFIRRHAAPYVPGHEVRLIAREDRFGRGGDHTAFNQVGYAGVRFTESRENYSRQHTVDDTVDGVDFEYLARNTRVNTAGVMTMALAPVAPDVRGQNGQPMLGRGEGYDAAIRWQASAGAAKYTVVWREAWNQDWQHEVDVGNVTEYTLHDISIDDYIFGVMAVSDDGRESMVTPYVRAPRPFVPVQRVP